MNQETSLKPSTIDARALKHAHLMSGKELLVTITKDLKADEVVKRYKSLAESKGVFYVLKSEIEIGPIYHRPPSPMHAHASICFVALILYRVTRTLLQESERRAQSGRGQ